MRIVFFLLIIFSLLHLVILLLHSFYSQLSLVLPLTVSFFPPLSYKQALHSANHARTLAKSHSLPFSRPSDYFAEMVKSDAHMSRIRQRLLDESATIARTESKRKEREGKKFGKQVQMEKLKEREKGRKEVEERLKGLKRKRQGALDNAQADSEAFDVAVEDALESKPSKRAKTSSAGGGSRMPRQARNQKFGFGSGGGRRSKQNDKSSTEDFGGRDRDGGRGGGRGGRGGGRGGRGGRGGSRGGGAGGKSQRLGKSRRAAGAGGRGGRR